MKEQSIDRKLILLRDGFETLIGEITYFFHMKEMVDLELDLKCNFKTISWLFQEGKFNIFLIDSIKLNGKIESYDNILEINKKPKTRVSLRLKR